MPATTPTPEQTEQLRLAMIHKAARLYVTVPGGLGGGNFGEFTPATLRPDHAIEEHLFGLRGPARHWDDLDLPSLITVEDVITVGLEATTNSAAFPVEEIESAILAAAAWVSARLQGAGMAW